MTAPGNILKALRLRPDYFGLIFHRSSRRHAFGLEPETTAALGGMVRFVGVFVNYTEDEIVSLAEEYHLAVLQLHGDESPELCDKLRDRGYEVWKAVGISSAGDFERLGSYVGSVDRFVFDSKSEGRGGSGRKFDWSLLDGYDLPTDFMLGGGIGPENAGLISSLTHPHLAGLDLNSRFELSPGIKDTELLNKFIKQIRKS